jgi:hypothetical protein
MLIAIPIHDRFTALDAVGPYEVLSRLPGAEVESSSCARCRWTSRSDAPRPHPMHEPAWIRCGARDGSTPVRVQGVTTARPRRSPASRAA